MKVHRIIVTGSRDHNDPQRITQLLDEILRAHGGRLTVMHGDCPTGADYHADQWCKRRRRGGFDVCAVPYPADWKTHRRAAGPIRNRVMVADGADQCIAFYWPASENRGTRDCVKAATAAGIPVVEFDKPHRRVAAQEQLELDAVSA